LFYFYTGVRVPRARTRFGLTAPAITGPPEFERIFPTPSGHEKHRAVPAPVIKTAAGSKVGLVTVGGCHAACIEALDLLAADGVAIDYMRVRGFPFGDDVRAFLESHEVNFVVEQNRDAQLRSLLMLETGVPVEKLESVRYYGGFPMSAHHVIAGVKAKLEKAA
jgi:2-oxoglutarate ferredoxin oxidoreductase subunit alpha